MSIFRWGLLGLMAASCVSATIARAQTGAPPPPTAEQIHQIEALLRTSATLTAADGSRIVITQGLNLAKGGQNFMKPSRLEGGFGAAYTENSAVTGLLDFRGLKIEGLWKANDSKYYISIPALDRMGETYKKEFGEASATRAANYKKFTDYMKNLYKADTAEGERLVKLLLKALARESPIDPLAGNPSSVQSALVRSSLDLSSGDSLIEQDEEALGTADAASGGTTSPGDPWSVGGGYSWGTAGNGRYNSMRIDGRVVRNFRIAEGGRALLKFDMPFTYSEVNGAATYTGQFGVGAEFPVIARRWSLEPRIAYGVTGSKDIGSVGHMLSVTAASRFVIHGIDRGRLVIGNMIGYSQTLSTAFTGYDVNPGLKNWAFRNGFAYEMPFKARGWGRQMSARFGYTRTDFAGDSLYYNHFHEVTFSLGVRGREESIRQARDLIRFNLSLVKTGDYTSWTAGLGFRF